MAIDRKRAAFTLIELLIVIGIIGLLLQLMFPAVQSARETARKTTCRNNLRQIGLAVASHESAHGEYPTGGWGWAWMGDPDRGSGIHQPGSWAYQLLPYLEEQELHQTGVGAPPEQKPYLAAELATRPSSIFNCSSRRSLEPTPTKNPQVVSNDPAVGDLFWYNCGFPEVSARVDYAAVSGDELITWGRGPTPIAVETRGERAFKYQSGPAGRRKSKVATSSVTGVVMQRFPVSVRKITDGLSKTYFAVEKRLLIADYETGEALNDDQPLWNGGAADTVVSTYWPPTPDPGKTEKRRDRKSTEDPRGGIKKAPRDKDRIGSAHPTGFNAVYCDGSVHHVAYDIDPEVHRIRGSRADGELEVGLGE